MTKEKLPSLLEVGQSLADGPVQGACTLDQVVWDEVRSSPAPIPSCEAGSRDDVDDCVRAAFTAGRPFWARYDGTGIDSELMTALISRGKSQLRILHSDYMPCGTDDCVDSIDVIDCLSPPPVPREAEQITYSPLACRRTTGTR